MNIYDLFINIMAQVLALANGTLGEWVNVPSNATGPLDANITLTVCGTDLVGNIATFAIEFANLVVTIFGTLF
jgi:hypothetical protein